MCTVLSAQDTLSASGGHFTFSLPPPPLQTTLAMFRSKNLTVRRRFSDFLGLYEKLTDKHAPAGFIVPPPPEKSILGN